MSELQTLLDDVVRQGQAIFNKKHVLHPIFLGQREDGLTILLHANELVPEPEEDEDPKHTLNARVRAEFIRHKVVRYALGMEAWVKQGNLNPDGTLAALDKPVREQPDKFEALYFGAEDKDGNNIAGHQPIIRPAGQPPYLDEFIMYEAGKRAGLFTGLLEPLEMSASNLATSLLEFIQESGIDKKEATIGLIMALGSMIVLHTRPGEVEQVADDAADSLKEMILKIEKRVESIKAMRDVLDRLAEIKEDKEEE